MPARPGRDHGADRRPPLGGPGAPETHRRRGPGPHRPHHRRLHRLRRVLLLPRRQLHGHERGRVPAGHVRPHPRGGPQAGGGEPRGGLHGRLPPGDPRERSPDVGPGEGQNRERPAGTAAQGVHVPARLHPADARRQVPNPALPRALRHPGLAVPADQAARAELVHDHRADRQGDVGRGQVRLREEDPEPAGHQRPLDIRLGRWGKMLVVSEHILDELTWRGLIAHSTDIDALRRDLGAGPLTLYCGFDPTAPSLQAGNLVPLLGLRRFQQGGHRPIVLAGGATGMIGDPRDTAERQLNPLDVVAEWTERIRGQLERFVDFDSSPTGALVENNFTWTGKTTVTEFLRDVGKHFSVNVMLSRETIKRRLENEGISYTEFSYLLLQSNDYLELYRRHGCTLQIGGDD